MRGFRHTRKRPRLPGRIGLLLGLGALSIAGARADTAPPPAPHSATLGRLSIRSEGGRIYVSENGGDFQEVRLGDTPEARRLAELLARRDIGSDKAAAALRPMILAGAGGDGFHWTAPPRGNDAAKPANGNRDGRSRPATGSPSAPHRPRNNDKG